jgi:hypothetical protein
LGGYGFIHESDITDSEKFINRLRKESGLMTKRALGKYPGIYVIEEKEGNLAIFMVNWGFRLWSWNRQNFSILVHQNIRNY